MSLKPTLAGPDPLVARLTDGAEEREEQARLQALDTLLSHPGSTDGRFDLMLRLAQRAFSVPMAAVTLVGEDRTWVRNKVGIDAEESPRRESFCHHAIQRPGAMVVEDAELDERFRDSMLRSSPAVRFYAGHPLEAPGGYRVGALCLMDTEPRVLQPADLDLLAELARWIEAEMAVDAELERAAEIQRALLPQSVPDIDGVEVAGRCLTAREVGGDFYDHYLVGDELQVTIADVMGKGFSAAIIAASVRSVLRGSSRLNDVATSVNRAAMGLEADLDETATFVTLFTARLQPATGRFTYLDAGHGLSGIVRRSGAVQQLASSSPPMGAVPGTTWEQQETWLEPGDTFISVSDGWLDCFETVEQAAAGAVRVVLESSSAQEVVDQITRIAGEHVAMDDLTVLVVRRTAC